MTAGGDPRRVMGHITCARWSGLTPVSPEISGPMAPDETASNRLDAPEVTERVSMERIIVVDRLMPKVSPSPGFAGRWRIAQMDVWANDPSTSLKWGDLPAPNSHGKVMTKTIPPGRRWLFGTAGRLVGQFLHPQWRRFRLRLYLRLTSSTAC